MEENTRHEDLTDLEGNTKIGVNITDDRLYDLEDQIKNLNNLGINYLENVENLKERIDEIAPLFYFINKHYLSIPNIEQVLSDPRLTKLVYRFLFVDMYNIILPNYLFVTKYTQYDSLDLFIQLKYSNNIQNLKTDLLRAIEVVIKSISEFKKLIQDINQPDSTKKAFEDMDEIAKVFAYYAEIIGSNDDISLKTFLKNYLYPVLRRYEDDLIWRAE